MKSSTELKTDRAMISSRLHPLWILFSIILSIKEIILPALFFFIFQADSTASWTIIGKWGVLVFFIYRMVSIIFEWWNFSYSFSEKELQIVDGKFVKHKRFIPLERIQNVQSNTHYFQRIFGLTSITLDTSATSSDSSVKLALIKQAEADKIKDYLTLKARDVQSGENMVSEVKNEKESKRKVHYKITKKEIITSTFTSFSLLALFPLLVGLFFKINEIISIDSYAEDFLNYLQKEWVWMIVTGLILILLSMCFGMMMTYIRYGNYLVTTEEDRIIIQKGVLNQTELTVLKDRVQAVKYNKSFIRRWFGIVEVELVCAGAFGDETIESNVLFPFISERKALELLPEILPNFTIVETMKKLPRAALWLKLFRPSYFWIIVTAILLFFWPDKWYLSPCLLTVILFLRSQNFTHGRHGLDQSYIQLNSGVFSVEKFVTSRKKIEQLSITESWIQRRVGLCTFQIVTKGTPVHHVAISDIPREEAEKYYKWYAEREF
ncbi:putative membrane protein [Bacillus pakistanensis]|uniref:Membrane protein n=1 Tax=Rossellomorea pakistanensis TaxID=992288 RepID=A0ABS2N760_9BACI|nr:PH domain-containing protein [Bacillus pakistanensis]MBM7583677.1 putative membrane protein [Bacillus pakistanensis]